MNSKGLIDLSRANLPVLDLPEPTPKPKPPKTQAHPDQSPLSPPELVVQTPRVTEPLSTVAARIPDSLHQAVRVFCTTHRLEVQRFVQDALTAHLANLQR